jgi:predicted metalloprotease
MSKAGLRLRGATVVLAIFLLSAVTVAIAGCGSDEGDDSASEVPSGEVQKQTVQTAGVDKRVHRALRDVEETPTRPGRGSRVLRIPGNRTPQTMDEYLTAVIELIDQYWTATLTSAGLPEPYVNYNWIPPGQSVQTECITPDNNYEIAHDQTMAHCGADDTIYFGQTAASQIWDGVADSFPGTQAGYGRAVGDFGVAHVLAHEYGHNLQLDLGLRNNQNVTLLPTKAFELQADCLAGVWADSAWRQGYLDPGDVEEAIATALATGDFGFANASHHGTPEERRAAWEVGSANGNPADCNRYLESTGAGTGGGVVIRFEGD